MPPPATTLVLDGIWGRPKRFTPLIEMIRERCGPAELFYYDCSGLVIFERLGLQLAAKVRQIGGPVNLVGFSMGGLVVRAAHLVDPTLPLHRVAFLNSPLKGSWLACLCPFGAMRQMRPYDSFMKRIANTDWDVPTLSTWCPGDTMVIPGRSARCPTAQQTIRCAVPMHVWPMWSRGIWRQVVDFLSQPARCD